MALVRNIELIDLLRALADPNRLALLHALQEGHEKCKDIEGYIGIHVTDLTEQIGLSQPSASKHLQILHGVGLVRVRRQGRWTYYMRDEDAILEAKRMFQQL